MTYKMMQHKTRHAAYKRPHGYEFQVSDESGWAAGNGRQPAGEEENNHRPQKASGTQDGRLDEDED